MLHRIFASLAALLICCGINVASAEEIPLDGIVAVVNNEIILQSDMDKSVKLFSQRARERGQVVPDNLNFRRQVLAYLVAQQVQLQEAEATGIDVSDSDVNNAMRQVAAANNQSLSEFRRSLTNSGGDYRRYRTEVRTEMIMQRLYERQVMDRIRISQQEIEDYLSERERDGEKEVEYSLQRILISLADGASAEQITAARELADTLSKQLNDGADFASLAIEHSTASEALNGGDIGRMTLASMPDIYADAVKGQAVGTVTAPLRTTNGFHILRIAGKSGSERHLVEQSRMRHILLTSTSLRDDEQTREELLTLHRRVQLGDSFARLAEAHSEDPKTASSGGEFPWLNPGEMPSDFEAVVNKLDIGEISEPFQTVFGWHIVEMLERRTEDQTDELLEFNARDTLRRRKAREEEELWRRRLQTEAYIEYRAAELAPGA
ncbi:MAG: peptidylprolyl isomerase [Pseudomonadota bacterium]